MGTDTYILLSHGIQTEYSYIFMSTPEIFIHYILPVAPMNGLARRVRYQSNILSSKPLEEILNKHIAI